jgi:hypothetical protein
MRDIALGEIPIVQANEQDAIEHAGESLKDTPGLVADDPAATADEDHDREAFLWRG